MEQSLLKIYHERWDGCTRCALSKWPGRRNVVHYRGNVDAPLLIIGEAPGATEALKQRPFVGVSGKLLDEMLTGVGLDPERDVLITNLVGCRPCNNRSPEAEEVQRCSDRLTDLLLCSSKMPRVMLLLGVLAYKTFRPQSEGLLEARGKIFVANVGHYRLNAMATYHPAFVLRVGVGRGALQRAYRADFAAAATLAGLRVRTGSQEAQDGA